MTLIEKPQKKARTIIKKLKTANWRLFSVRCVVFISVSISLLEFDPFRFKSATEELSQTLMLRIMSPTYKFGSSEDDSLPPEAAVVIWTDDTVDEAGGAWPVEYHKHADVIAGILAAGPSALFVDFKFLGRRKHDCTFTDMMNTIGAALFGRAVADPTNWFINGDPAPIFVASSFSIDKKVNPLLWEEPLVDDCDDPATLTRPVSDPTNYEPSIFGGPTGYLKPDFRKVVTGWRSPRSQYPLILSKKHAAPMPGASMIGELTPALAMYLYSQGVDVSSFREAPDSPETTKIKNDFQRPLFSQWPLTTYRNQSDFIDVSLCNQDPPQGIFGVVVLVIRELKDAFDDDHFDVPIQWCPPILQINAKRFLAGADIIERRDARTILDALKGRVVFYGADITDAPDLILSPAHGQIAGVFSHAVAYENLRLKDTGYLDVNKRAQRIAEIVLAAIASVGFALLLILSDDALAKPKEPEPKDSKEYFTRLRKKLKRAARAMMLILLVFIALFLGAVIAFYVDLALIDFIGLSTITAFVLKIVNTFFVEFFYFSVGWVCSLASDDVKRET